MSANCSSSICAWTWAAPSLAMRRSSPLPQPAREQHGYENEKPPRILQQVPSVVIEIADIRFDHRSDWRQEPLPETVPIEQRRSTARGDCVFLGWRGAGRGATRG